MDKRGPITDQARGEWFNLPNDKEDELINALTTHCGRIGGYWD